MALFNSEFLCDCALAYAFVETLSNLVVNSGNFLTNLLGQRASTRQIDCALEFVNIGADAAAFRRKRCFGAARKFRQELMIAAIEA